FDLYKLPKDFPDYEIAQKKIDKYELVSSLEEAMANSIGDSRFSPYLQLHEFEALILAHPQSLSHAYLERTQEIKTLCALVKGQNPELINGGEDTAPSKRIIKHIPEYNKVTAGVSVAKEIGLPILRAKCGHFNDWLSRLEEIAKVCPEAI
ncbi:MAG: DUF4276 family protein, partial [Candidatus Adiutrix sp.]